MNCCILMSKLIVQIFTESIATMLQETCGLIFFLVRFESSSLNRNCIAYPQGVSKHQSKYGGSYQFADLEKVENHPQAEYSEFYNVLKIA